jgi:hypothetical protein
MKRGIVIALACVSILSGGVFAAAIDSTIAYSSAPGGQLPASYNGWVAYQGAGSAWANDLGFGWGSNPNNTGSLIRTAATRNNILEMDYSLAGMQTATLDAVFRNRAANNVNGGGTPILSLEMNGVGVSINVVNHYPGDDSYWYDLVVFDDASDPRTTLLNIAQFAGPGAGGNGDPNWEHATLTLTAAGQVTLAWNGNTVFNQKVTGIGSTISQASWGSNTVVQPIPQSGGENRMFWQSIHLTADAVPEPATLCLLALGSAVMLRRRH